MESSDISPRLTGVTYLGDGLVMSALFMLHFNGACFAVIAASTTYETGGKTLLSSDYRFDESIEGKILAQITELGWGDPEEVIAKGKEIEQLEQQLAKLIADAFLPTMRRLVSIPIPDTQTLQDYLYPRTYNLQVLTEEPGDKLTCRVLDGPSHLGVSELHPPISTERLHAMGLTLEATDVPVVKPTRIVLDRRLQNFVWKVTVDGEQVICKASIDVFEHAIGDELEAYLKIRSAGVKLRVPKLKVTQGVVGILLGYIPHKHHDLRALLASAETGTAEVTADLRQKWAAQIRETVEGLHILGILWRDVKADNILIDENSDAVVLDFGGGNTMGWIDRDKYGIMEGEEQGLQKIMAALGVEI